MRVTDEMVKAAHETLFGGYLIANTERIRQALEAALAKVDPPVTSGVREALRPFAEVAGYLNDDQGDEMAFLVPDLTYGDIRRAKAAYVAACQSDRKNVTLRDGAGYWNTPKPSKPPA